MSRFRLDRSVSLRVVRPIRRMLGRMEGQRIPILMYHGINNVLGSSHPYFETNTSPDAFASQMRYLRDSGYTPLTLDGAVPQLRSREVPAKSVVITFDDGFRDFYTRAMPILQAHGFSATMFVVSSFMGTRIERFVEREFMTWGEVREVESLGIQIGSHTVSHPQLHQVSLKDAQRELFESKQMIQDQLGKAITSFSYPYAFPEQDDAFKAELRQGLVSAGYESGVTTVIGSAGLQDDRYFLPRIPANVHDDLSLFQAKLEGAYDWLHSPQRLYKRIKGRNEGMSRLNQDMSSRQSKVAGL